MSGGLLLRKYLKTFFDHYELHMHLLILHYCSVEFAVSYLWEPPTKRQESGRGLDTWPPSRVTQQCRTGRVHQCRVVCIGIREDTHVNIFPSSKGWLLRWSANEAAELVDRSWDGQASVRGVGRLCCCLKTAGTIYSSLGPARWGVLLSEARWSRREGLAESHLSLGFHVCRRSPGDFSYRRDSPSCACDRRLSRSWIFRSCRLNVDLRPTK
jgi:hypothetical protein